MMLVDGEILSSHILGGHKMEDMPKLATRRNFFWSGSIMRFPENR